MRLAVIGTFYNRPDNVRAIATALKAQTRRPDEIWALWEGIPEVGMELSRHLPRWAEIVHMSTPMAGERYAVIPYSLKQNLALDQTSADYIAYLTDDSLPHPDKYRRMVQALDEHPEWGAVYCSQQRNDQICVAAEPISDAYCVVDHTQVMHRRTEDRWPLDVSLMRIGDATFWRSLHRSLGDFHPIPDVLDTVSQTSDGISATW